MLGRMQVGEFSSIIGMIKRAQTVYGSLFTVSGVMCAFRKRALHDAGWWCPETITDDVDVSWRVQLAGWRLSYEPKALCWILMPETFKGLWRQRLRWSEGGTSAVISSIGTLLRRRRWSMLVIWLSYAASIVWAYLAVGGVLLWLAHIFATSFDYSLLTSNPLAKSWATLLALTYLTQAIVSIAIDSRFEPGIRRSLFWIIWFPFAFWLILAATAVAGFPKAIFRRRGKRGVWTSPDRGFR